MFRYLIAGALYLCASCASTVDPVPFILNVPPEEVVQVNGYYMSRENAELLESSGMLDDRYLKQFDKDCDRILTDSELRS